MKSKRSRTGFRIAAVLLGLLPFLVIELLCRVFGWGAVPDDAFAEFESVRPLFALEDGLSTGHPRRWRVADNRRGFFADESFAASKGNDEKRIFVLGGSTVQGRPYSIETSFGTFLELAARQVAPAYQWDAVNCGGISYASYRLLPILAECLQHQPDLVVICTGHNEFLESVTYADVIDSTALTQGSSAISRQLHSLQAVRNWLSLEPDRAQRKDTAQLPTEVEALLDFQGGFDAFTRDHLHREKVQTQFRRNLVRMVERARRANVPVVFVVPPSNLRDCPPFKSEFGRTVPESVRQRVRRLLSGVAASDSAAANDNIAVLQQAVQLDPQFAFSWYQLGRQLIAAGRTAEAETAFQRACDEDVCPLRMTSVLASQMKRIAEDYNVQIIDSRPLLAEFTRDGILGDRVLVDHIHPSFTSHQQIAIKLLAVVGEALSVPAIEAKLNQPESRARMEDAFALHLQSLDDLYYLRGQRTLTDLRIWAAGRADGPPLPKDVQLH